MKGDPFKIGAVVLAAAVLFAVSRDRLRAPPHPRVAGSSPVPLALVAIIFFLGLLGWWRLRKRKEVDERRSAAQRRRALPPPPERPL